MSHDVKRVDPRRPWVVTAEGRKRIVLGASGAVTPMPATPVVGVPVASKPCRTQQAAQGHLLVFVHSDRGGLSEAARQAVAAAALLADAHTEVVLLVFGSLSDDAAELGADRAIVLPAFDALQFAPQEEMAVLDQLRAEIRPRHIVAPDTLLAEGDLGRRLAAQRGLSLATHVVEINSHQVATYRDAGRLYGRRALPELILLAPDAVDARLPFVGRGECEVRYPLKTSVALGGYRDLGIEVLDLAEVALEEADMIVSAGNGVRDVATFTALARSLGAAIGASRVAVDDGKFTRDQQVGATGKTVNANLYIAIGISGAVQHLQGIKDCRHVIAINLDASAPIVQRANLSVIGDAQHTMNALLTEVQSARNNPQAAPGAAI